VGQRHAARRGSSYSIVVAWVNAAVRSDIACKRAGTGLRGCARFQPDGAMAQMLRAAPARRRDPGSLSHRTSRLSSPVTNDS
jgi:hypothetical protein